jgi:TRAP-type uncharacterized transport system substrate-binding protein
MLLGFGAALLLGGGASGSAHAQSMWEHANRGLVELMTGNDGASIAMAQDLAAIVNDGATRRLLPVIGRGGLENVIDVKVLRGVDVAMVQADALEYARSTTMPHLEGSITYIAKLHNEELHILAQGEVKRIEDLAGKKVALVGGARVTAAAAFDLLHIKVDASAEDLPVALAKLRAGDIVAVAFVAAKPAQLTGELRGASGVHYIGVPLTPAMANRYVPAQLTEDDYPGLVDEGTTVDTIAVGMVLVVANFAQNTERYRNVANFVDAFFTQLPRLQDSVRHPKWREVNVAADLPGWRRFPPADLWLKRNLVASAPPPVDERELREIFARFLDERAKASGGQTLTAEEKGQLFDQFQRWQRGRTH